MYSWPEFYSLYLLKRTAAIQHFDIDFLLWLVVNKQFRQKHEIATDNLLVLWHFSYAFLVCNTNFQGYSLCVSSFVNCWAHSVEMDRLRWIFFVTSGQCNWRETSSQAVACDSCGTNWRNNVRGNITLKNYSENNFYNRKKLFGLFWIVVPSLTGCVWLV